MPPNWPISLICRAKHSGPAEEQGVLNALTEDELQFRHQILHDWFAALRLATCSEEEETSLLLGIC